MGEGLDQVVVGDFLAEGLGELGEALGKAETDFPGFVFAGGEKGSEGVDLILFFAQVSSHRDQRLQTQHPNRVLIILTQLPKNRHDLLNNMGFVQVSRELSQFQSACSSNHRSVFLTQLDELLSQPFFERVRPSISMCEQVAGTHASVEPFSLGKSDNDGGEHALHLRVRKYYGDASH